VLDGDRAQPGDRRELLHAFVRHPYVADVVVPTILIRVAILAFAPIAAAIFSSELTAGANVLTIWERWDAGAYLAVARDGYDPALDNNRIAFFPLLPMLIRIGSIVAPPLLVGMAVSFVATVAAGVALYALVRMDCSRATARRAVIALNVFPTAFALVPPYSEPLFLALATWSFVAARRDDWRLAGALGLLAAMARLQGLFLLPALVVEYVVAKRRLGLDLAWTGLVGVGTLVYLGINTVSFGDPFFFMAIQRTSYYHQLTPPWQVLQELILGVFGRPLDTFWATILLAPLAAFILLGLVAAWSLVSRASRPSYATYVMVTAASLATLSWPISVPRYILGVFPIFIMIAVLTRRPAAWATYVAFSSMLLATFVSLFVVGRWAF
jgi:hypothetical protein